jgi:SAM-dependent methyltransferase
MDATQRFSNRVADYVRYRPGYPEALLEALQRVAGLIRASRIADIGSGTGLSTELFLRHGNPVYAIEPNLEMRRAAEERLQWFSNFHSLCGRAESIPLADHSMDYLVAGQAFHWFDRQQVRPEFLRVLRSGGWVVLFWNTRRTESTPFLKAYEQLLQDFGTDYNQVHHGNLTPEELRQWFAPGSCRYLSFDNFQEFDWEGLKGRLLSSSYTPAAGHPGFQPMMAELARLFDQYHQHNRVRFEYDTELYFGQLTG